MQGPKLLLCRAVKIVALGIALHAHYGISDSPAVIFLEGSTEKLYQLTGDIDRSTGSATLTQTGSRYGLTATDLGSSFEHKGRLFFLFGDSIGRPGSRDVMGWTDSRDPAQLRLDFHRADDGKWLPLTVPGINLGSFEIPSYGVSIDGTIYVVFTTDHSPEKTMGRSVVAVSSDDGMTFSKAYDLSDDKFINVAFWKTTDWLYVFGSGDYRQSNVYLARVKPNAFREAGNLQYLVAVDSAGQPQWSSNEKDAASLFSHAVVGEFSVAFCQPLGRYVMLYNSLRPRGITMRSAVEPWGRWSEGTVIFDPWRDGGYGKFMHVSSASRGPHDKLNDPGREREWGGEYGPYIVSLFTSGTDQRCHLYYTMSTWNPYQVVMMKSDLALRRRE